MNPSQALNDFGVVVPEWYQGYVDAVEGVNFFEVLNKQLQETLAFLNQIKAEGWDFAYAPGKWTIKELLVHLVDCERIFCYRALCFARNDQTELSGFDENSYVLDSGAIHRTPLSIINEYLSVRSATIQLFKNFDDIMLMRTGTANGKKFSVKLLGVVIAGHEKHHIKIISEKYLSGG